MHFSLLQDAFGTAPNAALRPSHTPKGFPGRRHEHYFLLHARAALAERTAAAARALAHLEARKRGTTLKQSSPW